MTKKAIIFDLDYTLYDAGEFYRSAFQEIASYLATKHGREPRELLDALSDKWREVTSRYATLFDDFLRENQLPGDEVETLVEMFHRHRAPLRLYPDAEQLFTKLHDRAHFGLITDGHGLMQRSKVRSLDLVRRLDAIVFTQDGGSSWQKPSLLPFRAICSQLGIEPREAIYVGDNPEVDAEGPYRLGMPAIRIRRGEYRDEPSAFAPFAAEIDLLTDLLESEILRLPN